MRVFQLHLLDFGDQFFGHGIATAGRRCDGDGTSNSSRIRRAFGWLRYAWDCDSNCKITSCARGSLPFRGRQSLTLPEHSISSIRSSALSREWAHDYRRDATAVRTSWRSAALHSMWSAEYFTSRQNRSNLEQLEGCTGLWMVASIPGLETDRSCVGVRGRRGLLLQQVYKVLYARARSAAGTWRFSFAM